MTTYDHCDSRGRVIVVSIGAALAGSVSTERLAKLSDPFELRSVRRMKSRWKVPVVCVEGRQVEVGGAKLNGSF